MYGLGRRVAVVAFSGWNDASDAATDALEHIRESNSYSEVFAVDPELYFDYQYTRPHVRRDAEGSRRLEWPSTKLYRPAAVVGDVELFLVTGTEPARAWQGFSQEVADALLAADVQAVITVGSLLSDAPHSRNLPVSASSEDRQVRAAFGLEKSQYEGPVGILSALGFAAEAVGIPVISMWVSVPHYVTAQTSSPKATLALLERLADFIGEDVPLGSLATDAARWEASVDAVVAEDEELTAYVTALEEARDELDSPDASGDAIAREFQRWLRKDTDGPQRG